MKTVEEIYAQMCVAFEAETGMRLHESSEMAVRLHALAAQIYGLYVQNERTLSQCFPQTARGIYLERHAMLRGLVRLGAQRAQGQLRFSVLQAQTEILHIPAGTVCTTAGLVRFETKQEAALPIGALFVDVAAQAVELGESGDVPIGTVRTMALAPVGIAACSNPVAFVGGAAQEEDEGLRARVLDSYRRMPNGANAAYYEREALSIAGIAAVNVIARARGRGTVDVVVASLAGAPTSAVIAQVQTHLQAQREIGVDVQVKAPTMHSFALSVQLTLDEGVSAQAVKTQVEQVLSAHFDGMRLGESVLHAKLGQLIFAVAGVSNYKIVAPAADVLLQPGQLARMSALTVAVGA